MAFARKALALVLMVCVSSVSSQAAQRLWSTSLPNLDGGRGPESRFVLAYYLPDSKETNTGMRPYFVLFDREKTASTRFNLAYTEKRDAGAKLLSFIAHEDLMPSRLADGHEVRQGLTVDIDQHGRYVLRLDQAQRFGYAEGSRIAGYLDNSSLWCQLLVGK